MHLATCKRCRVCRNRWKRRHIHTCICMQYVYTHACKQTQTYTYTNTCICQWVYLTPYTNLSRDSQRSMDEYKTSTPAARPDQESEYRPDNGRIRHGRTSRVTALPALIPVRELHKSGYYIPTSAALCMETRRAHKDDAIIRRENKEVKQQEG